MYMLLADVQPKTDDDLEAMVLGLKYIYYGNGYIQYAFVSDGQYCGLNYWRAKVLEHDQAMAERREQLISWGFA